MSKIRDDNSGAVLNTDLTALNKYKQERLLYNKISLLEAESIETKKILANICERLNKIEKIIDV
jgi:hypothetical protein